MVDRDAIASLRIAQTALAGFVEIAAVLRRAGAGPCRAGIDGAVIAVRAERIDISANAGTALGTAGVAGAFAH